MNAGCAARTPRCCLRRSAFGLRRTSAPPGGAQTAVPSTIEPMWRTAARRSASYSRFLRTGGARPRKSDPERAAPAHRGLDAELTSVDLDGPLRDGQPESTAADVRRRLVAAIVAVENPAAKLLRDARPGVDHIDLRRGRRLRHADANRPTWRRVFDGIVDEVNERLTQHESIAQTSWRSLGLYRQPLLLFFREHPKICRHLPD